MQTQNTPFPLQQIIDEFGFEGEYIGYRVSNDGHINNTFVLDFKNADGSSTSYLVQLINTNVFKNPDELMENIVGVTGYLRNIVIERGGDPERECLRVFFTKGGKRFNIIFNVFVAVCTSNFYCIVNIYAFDPRYF